MCAAVPVRALLQLPLLGVNRGYKGLYGGGWPLRGMGAAGTALGAADARTNEHYEIGTILTQKSQGVRRAQIRHQTSRVPIGFLLRFPMAVSHSRKPRGRSGFLRRALFFLGSLFCILGDTPASISRVGSACGSRLWFLRCVRRHLPLRPTPNELIPANEQVYPLRFFFQMGTAKTERDLRSGFWFLLRLVATGDEC